MPSHALLAHEVIAFMQQCTEALHSSMHLRPVRPRRLGARLRADVTYIHIVDHALCFETMISRFYRSISSSAADPVTLGSLGDRGNALLQLFEKGRDVVILTGAGISTDSGIPDYRSPGRPEYKPVQHHAFMTNPSARRRYWSRSFVGYHRMRDATPNAGHVGVSALLDMNAGNHCITQNVDRLHQRAGAKNVIELHGTILSVGCIDCKTGGVERSALQLSMEVRNARWWDHFSARASARPDGDVELPDEAYESFVMPQCQQCGSNFLKPEVVFHGGSIPEPVTRFALETVRKADSLLVIGSTLSTWSAFRLVREVAQARDAGNRSKRVGIINIGETRADGMADFKIPYNSSQVLKALSIALHGEGREEGGGIRE